MSQPRLTEIVERLFGRAANLSGTHVAEEIEVENKFTDELEISGDFNLSIWGTFVATVHLQRSFDGGTTWLDVAEYTEPIEDAGFEPVGAVYRVGVKTGGYTSGTVNVRLGQ